MNTRKWKEALNREMARVNVEKDNDEYEDLKREELVSEYDEKYEELVSIREKRKKVRLGEINTGELLYDADEYLYTAITLTNIDNVEEYIQQEMRNLSNRIKKLDEKTNESNKIRG